MNDIFTHMDLKELRLAINTLCNFLFCSHKTHWAPIIFGKSSDDKIWRYDLEGVLVPDSELVELAKTLLQSVESNENFDEYDCHGYVYQIYYEPIKKLICQ
jgi:hypothetical protein